MDESQNTPTNDLNLVPPEETPLQDAPQTDNKDGAIGDSLNPSNFEAGSDPLLNGGIKVEPVTPVEPTPIEPKAPSKTKIANKGLLIGIGITVLNLIICTVAIIICLSISSKPAGTTDQTIAEEDTFPNSLQCDVENCLRDIKLDFTPDQLINYLGINPTGDATFEFVLSDNISLIAETGSYPSFSYEVNDKSKLANTDFTDELIAEIKTHAGYSVEEEDAWKLEDVEELLNTKGFLSRRASYSDTYLWVNHITSKYIEVRFDTETGLALSVSGPWSYYTKTGK